MITSTQPNLMKSFNETMGALYVEYYNQHGEQKTYDFVLKTHVALSVLTTLYDNFIKDGIPELGTLPATIKQKYFDIGCKYFEEMGDRIKASKAVYVLSLITANE